MMLADYIILPNKLTHLINVKPPGGGRAWGGDLTFVKNFPSN